MASKIVLKILFGIMVSFGVIVLLLVFSGVLGYAVIFSAFGVLIMSIAIGTKIRQSDDPDSSDF